MSGARHAELERVEAEAMAAFYLGAPPAYRAARGVAAEELDGAWCMRMPGMAPPGVFNRIVMLGVDRPATDAAIDAARARMDAAGQPWQLALSPHAAPATLAEQLAALGFTPGYPWAKFARAATAAPPVTTDLAVRRLAPADGDAVVAVLVDAFGVAPWIAPWVTAALGDPRFDWFGAFDDASLATVGALYTRGDHAWFGFGASRASARGRGGQGAVLAARIERARERGATTLVVETGAPIDGQPGPSYRNLVRAGFEVAYVRPNYVPPPAG